MLDIAKLERGDYDTFLNMWLATMAVLDVAFMPVTQEIVDLVRPRHPDFAKLKRFPQRVYDVLDQLETEKLIGAHITSGGMETAFFLTTKGVEFLTKCRHIIEATKK